MVKLVEYKLSSPCHVGYNLLFPPYPSNISVFLIEKNIIIVTQDFFAYSSEDLSRFDISESTLTPTYYAK